MSPSTPKCCSIAVISVEKGAARTVFLVSWGRSGNLATAPMRRPILTPATFQPESNQRRVDLAPGCSINVVLRQIGIGEDCEMMFAIRFRCDVERIIEECWITGLISFEVARNYIKRKRPNKAFRIRRGHRTHDSDCRES